MNDEPINYTTEIVFIENCSKVAFKISKRLKLVDKATTMISSVDSKRT